MDLSEEKTKTFIKSILTDSILALCRKSLCFRELTIDGLLGITTDKDVHLMLHIQHTQKTEEEPDNEIDSASEKEVDVTPPETKKKKRKRKHEDVDEGDAQGSQVSPIEIKSEVLSDSDDIQFLDSIDFNQTKQETPYHRFPVQNSAAQSTNTKVIPGTPAGYMDTASIGAQTLNGNTHNSNLMYQLPYSDNNQRNENQVNQEYGIQSAPFFNNSAYSTNSTQSESVESLQCPICQKQLGSTSALSRHLKGHTGPTIMNCRVCSKPFNRKDNLRRHMKQHENHPNDANTSSSNSSQLSPFSGMLTPFSNDSLGQSQTKTDEPEGKPTGNMLERALKSQSFS